MTYTAEGGQRGGLTYTGNYAQEGRIYRGGDGYSGGGGGFYRRETLSSSRNADNTDADEDTFEDAECESLHGDKLRSGNGVIEGRDGGSDGGDGEDVVAGAGSGQDVTTFTFNTWVLTPGAPGQGYKYSYNYTSCSSSSAYFYERFYGGGGGGVLVDGEGPTRPSVYQGSGYGGGGSGYSSYPNGLPGVILMEVE